MMPVIPLGDRIIHEPRGTESPWPAQPSHHQHPGDQKTKGDLR